MPYGRTLFFVGSAAAIILLVPTAVTYTGKMPWNLSGSIQDQREAYSALAEQLAATAGNRGPIALVRALSGPFMFCVIPIGVIFWSTFRPIQKILVIATVLASVDLSILRGTTAQLADILVISASAFLVRVGFAAQEGGLKAILRRWKTFAAVAMALSLILIVLVGRTEARLGGKNIGCIGNSGVCSDISDGAYGHMSDSLAFGLAAVSGYFSQGYYGISLAAEKPFLTTWGIGHSTAISALFVSMGGKEQFANRTYTFRAREDGWSDETQWSSLITWIANDVGLWGALFVLACIGWVWGKVWIDAARAGDIRAAIFFCVIMMMIFYLPANNYMMQSYDGYATIVFWGLAWSIRRNRRNIAP
jgi:hypothetical protein